MTNPAEKSLCSLNASLSQIPQNYYLRKNWQLIRHPSSSKVRLGTKSKKGQWKSDAAQTEPKPHGLQWFLHLHKPQKQMAFVGHGQICPDGSYGSFQTALPLGRAKISVLSVLLQSCHCRVMTLSPSASNTACICPSIELSPCSMLEKQRWIRRGSTFMECEGEKDAQVADRVLMCSTVWEPRGESRNLKCVIREGLQRQWLQTGIWNYEHPCV